MTSDGVMTVLWRHFTQSGNFRSHVELTKGKPILPATKMYRRKFLYFGIIWFVTSSRQRKCASLLILPQNWPRSFQYASYATLRGPLSNSWALVGDV